MRVFVHVLVAYASSEDSVETVQMQGLWGGWGWGLGVEAVSAGNHTKGQQVHLSNEL